MAEEKQAFDVFESELVPKHELLTKEEKVEFLKKNNLSVKQLPRIKSEDPVVKVLGGKKGDVVKVIRASPVAGEYYYYRIVV